ncbi:MAG TPA: bifunctional oligoribonuclease/PAP phosphatase NrnA [Actinomycetota bacterium]|nr:bifunctional oligoribonuclease/PAP phosphatase NrnA [Actinomycetota bacterium]
MRYEVGDWDKAVQVLADASDIAIATHVNPDGDALGSSLGASLGLRKLGKRTYSSWGTSPLSLPPNYFFLPGADGFLQPSDVPDTDVWLVLDCGAADRMGELEERAPRAQHVINVDHHSGNTEFGDLNVVVTTASSTAELVTHLLIDCGVEIDRDIATCLYTGIVTDTGRFQYSNTSPDVLRLAADLLGYDVPAAAIALEVFESSPFGYLKLLGRVLERAVLDESAGFVYSWMTLEDLEVTNVAPDETEKVIDVVRSTRSAEVAALIKEQPDGTFRVSLRSKGPTSVGEIARANGGGGHELAAGFTASSVDGATTAILSALGRRAAR